MIHRIAFLLFALITVFPSIAHAQDPQALIPDTQQIIDLNSSTPSVMYEFAAEADSVWSFSAVRIDGDIDPVLRLYDEADSLLVANDNETRSSTDARLENWVVPVTGVYRLEVAREGEERARTAGRLTLTALQDSNSVPLSRLPIPDEIMLAAGEVYDLAADFERSPMTISFEVDFSEGDLFGLQMRGRDPQGIGDWLLVLGAEGATLQRSQLSTAAENPIETETQAEGEVQTEPETQTRTVSQSVLLDDDTPLDSGAYTIRLENNLLELLINSESVLSIEEPAAGFSFLQGVNLRLIALPDNAEPIVFRSPYASSPFYPDGDTTNAMPPVQPDQRLYSYADIPLRVVGELRELAYIETGGGLAFTVPDAIIETSAAGFSSVPLEMAMGFQNMVLHFSAVVRTGDQTAACGMNIHQQDSANFISVLFSADGNAYILPYQDGALNEENLAVKSLWINQGIGTENHVILVAQDDEAILFINGVMVGTLPLEPASGGLQMTMVVNEPIITRCTYGSIWLWSLDG